MRYDAVMAQQNINKTIYTHDLSILDRVAYFPNRLPHSHLHSPHTAIVNKHILPNPVIMTDCLCIQLTGRVSYPDLDKIHALF